MNKDTNKHYYCDEGTDEDPTPVHRCNQNQPRVLNRARTKTTPDGAVYVGRPSKWGNPFVIGKDGTREEVIAKYRDWLFTCRLDLCVLSRRELAGKDLVCWCAPLPCHADVLLEVANLPVYTEPENPNEPTNT